MSDWKARAKANSTPASEWKKRIIEQSRPLDIDQDYVDALDEAPVSVRLEAGALDKPEDKLAALKKRYPDAAPFGDSNFIMTDPETGKVIQYNRSSWMPSLGDIASVTPEIGESLGGGIGAILGAFGGPLGAIGGAGAGSVFGRESTQRGLNAIFGNDDTRSTGEQIRDASITAGLGMAGEGVGRLAAKGFQAGKDAWVRGAIGGGVDDPVKAAERAADLRAIGADPTAGMVNGSEKSALFEHSLIPTRSGDVIQSRIEDAFAKQNDEFGRIVGSLSDQPLDIASAGARLREQAELAKEAAKAQSEKLYGAVDSHVTAPAISSNTNDFLASLTKERAGYGSFDELNRAPQADRVIAQTSAILQDAAKGMSFEQLKSARSAIGGMASDETDRVLKGHLNGLYASLTKDMEATAAQSSEGLSAFKAANDFYRDEITSPTGFGKGGAAHKLLNEADTDNIMKWVMATDSSGGNRIAAVRRTIQKSEGGAKAWDEITAGVIDRLGRNNKGEFDPGTYLRNFTDMSDNAKSAMFAGTGNAQLRNDLDRLARISENWTKYRGGKNHSNTSNHIAARDALNPMSKDNLLLPILGAATYIEPMSALAAGGAGLAKKGIPAAVNKLSQGSRAKLMTSPETVNWLAGIPTAEMQKGGLKGHLGKLNQLRKKTQNQTLAQAIGDYMFSVGYEPERDDE